MELTVSPHRVASPSEMPVPPQPEVPPTAPAASLEKAVVIPDVAVSSSCPVTWEEHVSYPVVVYVIDVFVCSCCILQPFGRALVEAGKAFFGMEQEKNVLRG